MPRKTENTPENDGEQPRPPEGEKIAPRLSVQLDEHGSIAWDRMRPETRDKLRAALQSPGGANVVPFERPAAGPAATSEPGAQSIPPELCEVLYDSLSALMMGLARRQGYTVEQVPVLAFTPQEKNALVPATVKVLDKYGASLGKYQEEIVLGTLLTTIITGKLSLLRKTAEVRPFPAAPPVSTSETGSQAES